MAQMEIDPIRLMFLHYGGSTMIYDSQAIMKAYPNVVVVHDDVGVFEQTGTDENDDAILKEITVDQSLVDAARKL